MPKPHTNRPDKASTRASARSLLRFFLNDGWNWNGPVQNHLFAKLGLAASLLVTSTRALLGIISSALGLPTSSFGHQVSKIATFRS